MSMELRLTFLGLNALVPRKDANNPNPAGEWLAVLPALEAGDRFSKDGREFRIPPHQALLVANELAVRPGSTKPVHLRFGGPSTKGIDLLLFRLKNEVVEIDSGTAGLRLNSNGLSGSVPTQPHEVHDIKWVPPIAVPFKKSLLDPQTLRPEVAVAGVVRLDRGTLETEDVHRDLTTGEPAIYQFLKGDGTVLFRQALAKSFRLRVDVAKDEATLVLTDRNGDTKSLVVGVHEGCEPNENGDLIVEVYVFNRELEAVLGFGAPPDLSTGGAFPADTDFAIFYKLSPAWTGMSGNDVALPSGGGGGADRKPCEPPTYPGMA